MTQQVAPYKRKMSDTLIKTNRHQLLILPVVWHQYGLICTKNTTGTAIGKLTHSAALQNFTKKILFPSPFRVDDAHWFADYTFTSGYAF